MPPKIVQIVNSSDPRRIAPLVEQEYRRLWGALHRADDDGDGLGQHERELLAHVGDGASLGWLAAHLLLPKSSASVLVKDLERRGFLLRRQRRLLITLTEQGRAAVAADHVLDLDALAGALRRLAPTDRTALLALLRQLGDAARDQRKR
jgi:DNA-binding MarR family transcriptional regulator